MRGAETSGFPAGLEQTGAGRSMSKRRKLNFKTKQVCAAWGIHIPRDFCSPTKLTGLAGQRLWVKALRAVHWGIQVSDTHPLNVRDPRAKNAASKSQITRALPEMQPSLHRSPRLVLGWPNTKELLPKSKNSQDSSGLSMPAAGAHEHYFLAGVGCCRGGESGGQEGDVHSATPPLSVLIHAHCLVKIT